MPNPPLVFLHGFLGHPTDWDGVVAQLSGIPFTTASLLLDTCPTPTFSTWPQAFYTLYAHLGPVHLVGYSMGGRLALALAHVFPAWVQNLTLIGAHPGGLSAQDQILRHTQDQKWSQKLRSEPLQTVLDTWYSQPLFSPFRNHASFQKTRTTRQHLNPSLWADYLEGLSVSLQPDFRPIFQQRPVCYIAGEYDTKYCNIAKNLAKTYPKTEVHIVPNCGHVVHLEQPEADVWLQLHSATRYK